MEKSTISLFISLYTLGNKVKQIAKKHNADMMSELITLWLARKPTSASELSLKVGIKMSAMSQKINYLQDKGLLERVTSDDARVNLTQITEAGEKHIQAIRASVPKECPHVLVNLSAEEIDTLDALLEKLTLSKNLE